MFENMNTKIKTLVKSQENLLNKVQKTIFSIYEKSEEEKLFLEKDISLYRINEQNYNKKISINEKNFEEKEKKYKNTINDLKEDNHRLKK
jgi:hypothetical protein